MTLGRPSEYSEEILNKANEYLDLCKDSFERSVSDNGKFTHFFRQVKIPTIGGLARFLKVSRSTLYEWEKATIENEDKTVSLKYPDFSDIIEQLRAEQEERLINNGLSGDYNSTIAKVLLTKHGYADKVEQDVTSAGEKISVGIIKYSEAAEEKPEGSNDSTPAQV